MRNRDAFSSYHPAVSFLYFAVIFIFSCVCSHPVCLLISFFVSVYYYIGLEQKRAWGFLLKGVLPLLLFTALINPAFSHEGFTVLFYLPGGNPVTLESILYGVQGGIMVSGIIIWFACFSAVFTTDKFIYLFGRVSPAFSLLLSMTLRFLPRFKRQYDAVREIRGAFAANCRKREIFRRIKDATGCFFAVVTWSLESAVDTADSMKSRGYAAGKRTAYSVFDYTSRDKTLLSLLALGGVILFSGLASGELAWRYYPDIRGILFEPMTVFTQFVYLLFCLTPVIIDKKEEIVWKHLESKI